MKAKAWYEQIWEQYSYPTTAFLLLYMLFGTAANCMVCVVYSKDKKQTGRDFILCLAVVDILACLFVLPQVPMFVAHLQFGSLPTFFIVFSFESIVILQSYQFTQVAMSLDQFLGVYFPFKHRKFAPIMKKIMLFAAVLTICGHFVHLVLSNIRGMASFPVLNYLSSLIFRLVIAISFLTLLVVYPLIVMKLYRQHRKIRPKTVGITVVSSTVHEAGQQRTANEQLPARELQIPRELTHQSIEAKTAFSTAGERGTYVDREPKASAADLASRQRRHEKVPSKATRKMHVQAIKVYSSIFLLFTLSLVSLVIVILSNSVVWSYVYFLNHIGNPIIYYVFVPKFRETVNMYCRHLKCW